MVRSSSAITFSMTSQMPPGRRWGVRTWRAAQQDRVCSECESDEDVGTALGKGKSAFSLRPWAEAERRVTRQYAAWAAGSSRVGTTRTRGSPSLVRQRL